MTQMLEIVMAWPRRRRLMSGAENERSIPDQHRHGRHLFRAWRETTLSLALTSARHLSGSELIIRGGASARILIY